MRCAVILSVLLLCATGCSREKGEPAEMRMHPDFTITRTELESLTEGLPSDIQTGILQRPEYFLQLLKDILSQPEEIYYLVDKEHGLPADYIPPDLVRISSYPLSVGRDTLELRAVVMADTLAMTEAARQEGIDLLFSSAYRSYPYQQKVYDNNVRELGKEQADRESAEPGKSQHQLGTVVDFGSITDAFAFDPAGIWLAEHAWKYGFSLSYPKGMEEVTGYKYEPWHFRHITRKGTELEREFFSGVQQYLLQFIKEHREVLSGYLSSRPVS